MQIQERDVYRKVDLIASLAESETGGEANNFTMQWNLPHLQQFSDRKLYLVLENAAFTGNPENNTGNNFNTILAVEGLQLNNDIRGTSQPNTLAFLPYAIHDTAYKGLYFDKSIPEILMPLMAVPDRYVTFRLLKATTPHADVLTAGGIQLYTAIDMKFSLYIMKEKR